VPKDFSVGAVLKRLNQARSDQLGNYLAELQQLISLLKQTTRTDELHASYTENLAALLKSTELSSGLFKPDDYGPLSQSINTQHLVNLIITIPTEFDISSLLAIFKAFQNQKDYYLFKDIIVQRLMRDYLALAEENSVNQNNRQKALLQCVNPTSLSEKISKQFKQFSSLYLHDALYKKLNTLQKSIQAMRKQIKHMPDRPFTPMEQIICDTLHQETTATVQEFQQAIAAHSQSKTLQELSVRADNLLRQSDFKQKEVALASQGFSANVFYFLNPQDRKNFLRQLLDKHQVDTSLKYADPYGEFTCCETNPQKNALAILNNNKLDFWESIKNALRHPFTPAAWQAVQVARKKKSIFSAADLLQLFVAATPQSIYYALQNQENCNILKSDPEIAIQLRCYLQLKYPTPLYRELHEAWPNNNLEAKEDPRITVSDILAAPNFWEMNNEGRKKLQEDLNLLLDNPQRYDTDLFFTELLKDNKYVNKLSILGVFNRDTADALLEKLYSRQKLANPEIIKQLLLYVYPEQISQVAGQMNIAVLLQLYTQLADGREKQRIQTCLPLALAGAMLAYAGSPAAQGVVIQTVLDAGQALLTESNAKSMIDACEAEHFAKLFAGNFPALLLVLEHGQTKQIQDNFAEIANLLVDATQAQQQQLLEKMDQTRLETIFIPLYEALDTEHPAKRILEALINQALLKILGAEPAEKSLLEITLAIKGINILLTGIMQGQQADSAALLGDANNTPLKRLLEIKARQASITMRGTLLGRGKGVAEEQPPSSKHQPPGMTLVG